MSDFVETARPYTTVIKPDGRMTATRNGESILVNSKGKPRYFRDIWRLIATVRKEAP